MRKVIFVMLLLAVCTVNMKGQNVANYLSDYSNFVSKVVSMDTITKQDKTTLDSENKKFSADYHSTYKAKMTDAQLKQYIELHTRYSKKMTFRNSGKVTSTMDSLGVKTVRGMKRTGSRVSGFVKGIFTKQN